MTQRIAMSFGAVAGTSAGLGRTATRSLVADRPEGRAGGQGLGFNGGELMAAALGGCFWNDLHYVAEEQNVAVTVDNVAAEIELAGNPPRIARAFIRASLSGSDAEIRKRVFDAACAASTIANSVLAAFPIRFECEDSPR